MNPEDVRKPPFNCRCVPVPVEPFESMVARGIAGLEMLLREACEGES